MKELGCTCRSDPSGHSWCDLHGHCDCWMETWGTINTSTCQIHGEERRDDCMFCKDTGLIRKRRQINLNEEFEVCATWCHKCDKGQEWKELLDE